MKYFIDTEFIEGFHKPLFGKKRHFIDLISIGIVAEDGREYYAISKEYNYKDADDWVKENVIIPIYKQEISGDRRNHIDAGHFHKCIPNGKSNKQIAEEIFQFCTDDTLTIEKAKYYNVVKDNIEFYGYYADYDWVLFCSLFGRMIDLPNGFPMYCKDLKQMLDEKANAIDQLEMTRHLFSDKNWEFTSEIPKTFHSIDDYTLDMKIEMLKSRSNYPKQTNEHNALSDAKWNFELYKFLKNL